MRSTKFWILSISILFMISVAAAFLVHFRTIDGSMANIYQDGICINSIDLSKVEEAYTIVIPGAVTNTIAVEQGRICVMDATCADRVCVHQGWISNGVIPIVCLPNALVIQVEDSSRTADIDAISR